MSKKLLLGLLFAVLVAGVLSPFASPHPDGLERIAEDKNFLARAEGKGVLSSPIPDYMMPGIETETVATGVAGVTGVILTYGFVMGIRKFLVKEHDCSS